MRYAIFDLDGTLLDTMEIWESVPHEYLKSYDIVPPKDLDDRLKTMGTLQAAQYFIDVLKHPKSVNEIISEINHAVIEEYRDHAQLKPYVGAYLKKLKNDNVKMCIATASEREVIVLALIRLGVLEYFDFIVTCTEVGLSKDSPEIFLNASEKFGALPKEIVVFEDALHAMKTAKNAGFQVVGVYDKSSKGDEEIIMKICDQYIQSFEEML